jgi:hypothetical protein
MLARSRLRGTGWRSGVDGFIYVAASESRQGVQTLALTLVGGCR